MRRILPILLAFFLAWQPLASLAAGAGNAQDAPPCHAQDNGDASSSPAPACDLCAEHGCCSAFLDASPVTATQRPGIIRAVPPRAARSSFHPEQLDPPPLTA